MSVWDEEDPDRKIYKGLGLKDYDPLKLRRDLVEVSQGKIWVFLRKRREAIQEMHKAKTEEDLAAPELKLADAEKFLISVARRCFASAVEGEVRSDANCLSCLDHFLAWLEKKGETTGNGPT